MNSPARDIKDILISSSSGLNLVFGTTLHVSREPSSPDQVVTIYDTGGFSPEVLLGSDSRGMEKPTIQIRVRGNKKAYNTTYDLAEDIKNVLHTMINRTVNGTKYVGAWLESDIFFLDYDENDRPVFTMNFLLFRTS